MVQTFRVNKIFFKEMCIFIQQGRNQLIKKSDSKDMYRHVHHRY